MNRIKAIGRLSQGGIWEIPARLVQVGPRRSWAGGQQRNGGQSDGSEKPNEEANF